MTDPGTLPSPPQEAKPTAQILRMSGVLNPDDAPGLIHAIATAGCRASFIQLFSHFAPRIAAFARRGGATVTEAEELAQETMLAVWRNARQFDPARATAAGWIFAIARNLRIDTLRRARLTVPSDAAPDTASPDPGPDTMLETADRARRVRDALMILPKEQMAMIRLAFLEDRTHAEIGRATGVPLGTVKSRLRLALARLRAALDDAR
jgi:RNA polymerase sigma-70 factor (ECF subfamily)